MELSASFFADQFRFARSFCERGWHGIPQDRWLDSPENVGTNLLWQAGHLLISQFFSPIVVVFDGGEVIKQRIAVKEYLVLFGFNSNPAQSHTFSKSVDELLADLQFVQEATLGFLEELSMSDLEKPPVRPHPIGKTKLACLNWSIQHEMWHAGQIALLRKSLGYSSIFDGGK